MSATSICAPVAVPGAGCGVPLTVTLMARAIVPSASTYSSGVGPAPTTTSASQTIARRCSAMAPPPVVLMLLLLALPSRARLSKPDTTSSGLAGTALLVALPGRGATVTTTPGSPSIRLCTVPELSPSSPAPPNRPYQCDSGRRTALTVVCVASMSMPWRPPMAVSPAAVPSSSTRVLELMSLSAVAVAPPAKPPAVASETAVGRRLRACASRSTVRASTAAPLPMTALVRAVMSLVAVARDTEMKPPPLPEAVALVVTSVTARSLKSPAASIVTPLALTWGAAPSSLRPRITPSPAWPTKALLRLP